MFSCIIPLYNSPHIDLQFQNLKDLYYQKGQILEYIFVNDGSDKDFIAELEKKIMDDTRFSLLTLPEIHKKYNRVTQARNLGAYSAKGEVLIFIDQDTLLSQKYIDTLSRIQIKKNEIILGPYYGYNNHKKILSQNEIESYLSTGSIHGEEYKDFRIGNPHMVSQDHVWKYFCASNLIIRRDDFYISGGFDETLVSWGDEDVELGYRLSKSMKISFNSELSVLNLSSKLYRNPFNILEVENVTSLFDNILKNFQKHQTKEYLGYLLERYNGLDMYQKEYVSMKFNNFIQGIQKNKIY